MHRLTSPPFLIARHVLPICIVGALLALGLPASGQVITWNQPAGGDFNTAGNWNPNAVPAAGDVALFNIALSGNVTLSANAEPGSIIFDTNATSFSLGALGGSTITTANAGAISILSTLTAANQTFTINAPLILTPNSTTTPGTFTIQNDGTSASTILVIAGGISSSATSGAETLTLAGANTGANLISGAIVNGGATSLILTKSGAGTWTLSGANTYSGGTNIAAGKLVLSGGNNRLLSTGTLNFTGSSGTLDVGATSQTLGGLTFLIAGINSNVITGAGGTLSVTSGSIQIGGGSTMATGSNSTTVDMSGLGTFNYSNASGSFSVGGRADVSAAVSGSGMLTMATTNVITAASFIVSPFSESHQSDAENSRHGRHGF